MTPNKLSKAEMIENALREIAANAAAKGGEWASEQAFTMLEFLETHAETNGTTSVAQS